MRFTGAFVGIPLIGVLVCLSGSAAPVSAETAVGSGQAEKRDPAYWVDRMEQALLPGASFRGELVLENEGRPRSEARLQMRLLRVQGPERIRSVVAVESPPSARRVLRISSRAGGGVKSTLFRGVGDPLTLRAERDEPFLDSVFRYEDLGFVELGHRARNASVSFEDRPEGRVVRIDTGAYGPYGKVVTWLDPATALPREVEFFDADGRLARSVHYGQVDREGAYPFPLQAEAVELATGRKSRVRYRDVELGVTVYEDEFGDLHLRQLLQGPEQAGSPESRAKTSSWIRTRPED